LLVGAFRGEIGSFRDEIEAMNNLAFLFPGQGSQAVGMGKELAANYSIAKQTFDESR